MEAAPGSILIAMRIALHACCGPCLLEPFDAISADAEKITVVYANPNIHPVAEYERRRDTLREYAGANEIDVVELEYDPAVWLARAGIHGRDQKSRCKACYEVRFELVARWAQENGYDALATTLTVSPYQDAEAIAQAGKEAAQAHGLVYLERDFRELYPQATQRSRELGMYRQNYCGCLMSELEAREQREQRKAERRRNKG